MGAGALAVCACMIDSLTKSPAAGCANLFFEGTGPFPPFMRPTQCMCPPSPTSLLSPWLTPPPRPPRTGHVPATRRLSARKPQAFFFWPCRAPQLLLPSTPLHHHAK